MSYQPRSTNPYIMEKKLNECVGGGGLDPSVLEEIEAEISVLGSENATMAQDIIDIKGSLNSINDNLSGFKFYPTGTAIVGLISDDSAYTDANGKYVIWGTATANQLVEDNPNTYKSIPSTEDLRGEVGADTAVPFKSRFYLDLSRSTLTIPANGKYFINTGFRPKRIWCFTKQSDSSFEYTFWYDSSLGNKCFRMYYNIQTPQEIALPQTAYTGINSVEDTGFYVYGTPNVNLNYFMVYAD